MRLRLRNIGDLLIEKAVGILKIALIVYGAVFLILKFGAYVSASQQSSPITSISLVPNELSLQELQSKEQSQNIGPAVLPDQLFIPKLQITAPIIEVLGNTQADFVLPLKKGVALYPLSKPGQAGRAVILGHSAPPNWPKINYDWVFSRLGDLQEGDEIRIAYQGREYLYIVKNKLILKKGQLLPLSESPQELVLITCWPPGLDYQRMAVFAEPSS